MYLTPALRYRICQKLPYELWIKIMEYAIYHKRLKHIKYDYKSIGENIFSIRINITPTKIYIYYYGMLVETIDISDRFIAGSIYYPYLGVGTAFMRFYCLIKLT